MSENVIGDRTFESEVPVAESAVPEDLAPGNAASEDEVSDAAGRGDEGTQPVSDAGSAPTDEITRLKKELAERTADLQRLAAEYQNYKRRVDRDRDVARSKGVAAVVADLLPVFDAIDQADNHQELTGGFKLVADELTKVAGKHGLIVYGEVGDEFDPVIHEALMQLHVPGYPVTSVTQVMQKGVILDGKVLRPARVAVTEPSEPESDAAVSESGNEETTFGQN